MKRGTDGQTQDELAKSIFLDALEIASEPDRLAYLDRRCDSDLHLRAEVEALLLHQQQLGDYLEHPALDRDATRDLTPPSIAESPGTVIGPYKLREQIGEGGMGVVYVAQQNEPVRRKVALKVIKPGMDSRQVVARFEAERQALAMMDHPNIARVFDGGTTDSGRPFFVMELVRGVPITEYCDEQKLTIRERLELFVLVCRAVQHAHQKGIIHRDLKPSNILITLHDGVPVPKVIDFGVAKATGQSLTDKTIYTAFTQLIGTPLYMSPEQVELSGLDIDTRSDIYSLGVLLYELLTGTTPFDAETLRNAAFDEMRRIIREQEPQTPSTRLSSLGETLTTVSARRKADPRRLGPSLKGELDWVVMKALEKDRRRRYETANDFASDVLRFLTDQPVQACPPSASYRLRKFVRRNKGPVLVGLALAALLVLGTVGTSLGLVWARRALAQAKQAEARASEEAEIAKAVKDFLQNDLLAQASPFNSPRNKKVTVEEVLGRAAARIAGKFAQQPRIEAEIRMTIGSAYNSLGDYTAAQPHIERAWEISSRVLREEDPRTLGYMNNLAGLYMNQGKFAQAEPLLVKALETARRILGEQHPETLNFTNNLAYLYQKQGKPAQAEPLLVKALEVGRRVLGEENPGLLRPMGNLAELYEGQRKFAQAESLRVKALEIARRRWGEENLATVGAMTGLASLYMDQGKLTEAEPLLAKPLEVYRRVLGEEHPDTLAIMHNLAVLYDEQVELSKAETLYVKILEVGRPVLGETHPDMLTAARNLAHLYWLNRKFERSASLLEEVLKGTRAKLGPEHPHTLLTMGNLAKSHLAAGRLPEATHLLEQAWTMARKQPGLLVATLTLLSGNLGEAYEQAGQFARAESLYREALEMFRQRQKEASSDSTYLQILLADNLLKQRRYAEAEPLLRECLAFREQHEPNLWQTASTKSALGGSLLGQRKYAEAEALLLAGYEGMVQSKEKIPPVLEVRMTEAIERLVQLYEATGNPDKADAWRKKRSVMKSAKAAGTNKS